MNYCKDCKYWETRYNTHECLLPEWVEVEGNAEEDGMAFYADAADDTNLHAGLKTGPLFGCNKFEK